MAHASATPPARRSELRNREVQATSVGAWATSLVAVYETDPDVVAAVLPPPLEPTDRAARAGHDRRSTSAAGCRRSAPARSRCRRATRAPSATTRCVMPMTTEQSVDRRPRDVRRAEEARQVTLDRDGDRVTGTITRLGTTFVEVAGTVGERRSSPPDGTRTDFYFKFLPAPDGKGFDAEPALVYCHRDETTREARRASTARVILREVAVRPGRRPPVRRLVEHHGGRAAQRPAGRDRQPGARPSGCSRTCTSATTTCRPVGEDVSRCDDLDGQGRGRHRRRERHRPGDGRALRSPRA